MEQKVFREKSMKRISSPEQLDDYLHVITPAAWILILAVLILLAGFIFWCSMTSVESRIMGSAEADSGVLTISFEDEKSAERVEVGMTVHVGDLSAPVLSVGQDEKGNTFAIADLSMPDGKYDVQLGYNSTQIISFLFN